jgi:cytochrome c oxidase cbb3-type subunit 3
MNNDDHKNEIDQISGVETTGHEWDGLKELNNPTPRWWLWVFYITIIWSVGYWVVYPAWPTISGSTKGVVGWTQFEKLKREQAEIVQRQGQYLEKFHQASFDQIMNDPELYAFATAGGASAFKDNCATCHGTGGAGGNGYPNLNDDDWLWGGRIEDIYQTLDFGIRSPHEDTRVSLMPSFGVDGLLKRDQITTLVDYVLALAKPGDHAAHPGHTIFQEKCASCHGPDAKGNREFGAPNLTDAIWLYGGTRDVIYKTIFYGRSGVMPYWKGRLDEDTIRQLTVYIHSLGGGEESETSDEPALYGPGQDRTGQ